MQFVVQSNMTYVIFQGSTEIGLHKTCAVLTLGYAGQLPGGPTNIMLIDVCCVRDVF